jgi:hypothetical protein
LLGVESGLICEYSLAEFRQVRVREDYSTPVCGLSTRFAGLPAVAPPLLFHSVARARERSGAHLPEMHCLLACLHQVFS